MNVQNSSQVFKNKSYQKEFTQLMYATLDDINAIILVSDQEGKIVFANKAIKEILGYNPEELLGDGWWILTKSNIDATERKPSAISLAKGELSINERHLFENAIVAKDGRVVWTQWTNTINAAGYLVGIAQDITIKKSLEAELIRKSNENELLLREIHHRVKNNLQIISSMLNLQFNSIDDPNVLEALTKSKNRINSMALVHSKIYLTGNLASIDFDEYLLGLVRAIEASYYTGNKVKLVLNKSGATFEIDLTINLGLIINELITNSYKHAFTEIKDGIIDVRLIAIGENKYRLIVQDNGLGTDNNSLSINQNSIGLEIVYALIDQINGTLEMESLNGLKYTITFNAEVHKID
jgi:PAS domain S-box-containing protein